MTEEQLETAKSLRMTLSNIEYLFDLFHRNSANVGNALYQVYINDKTFNESFDKLIKETKERLQKEFEEL